MRTANLSALIGGVGVKQSAGVAVNPWTVGGIPAFTRAVRIAAEAVASLQMRVFRGVFPTRSQVDTVWQARLLRGPLSTVQTRFQFFETIEESLSKRGNAYIWKNTDPSSGRVVEMIALHPDQVYPKLLFSGVVEYQVQVSPFYVDPVGKGQGFYSVTTDTILHIKGHGDGGAVVAPSPVQLYADSLGVGIAKLRHEANTYAKGTALRLAVELPASVTPTQADQFRDQWKETYEGADGQATAILGGGGVIKPISLSMADAQFIESQNFGVAEAARIVGVPASLLDSGEHRSTSTPMMPEWEQMRWLRYGLGPRLERIESSFVSDPSLFGPSSLVYPAFDTEKFIRGDLTTEANIALSKVQSGQWLVDEARQRDNMPPLPDGAGQIPQVVPVGGGANPIMPSPPPNPGGGSKGQE
jgi:HK97 family phage portal protein